MLHEAEHPQDVMASGTRRRAALVPAFAALGRAAAAAGAVRRGRRGARHFPPTRAARRRRTCACAPSWPAPGTIRSLTWQRLDRSSAPTSPRVTLRFVPHLAPTTATASMPATGRPTAAATAPSSSAPVRRTGCWRSSARRARPASPSSSGTSSATTSRTSTAASRRSAPCYALAPSRRVELMRRFELEADCYAGVWMHASDAWSAARALPRRAAGGAGQHRRRQPCSAAHRRRSDSSARAARHLRAAHALVPARAQAATCRVRYLRRAQL